MKQYSNETKAPVIAAMPEHRPQPCALVTWWRLKPAPAFDATALTMMQDSLSKIDMLGEPRWKHAAAGDASASIGIALSMRPANSHHLRHDLAMTALAVVAARQDSTACLTISYLLRRLPDAGKAEARLAASWLMRAYDNVASGGTAALSGSAKP